VTAAAWHPNLVREMLPGRSVHEWDRLLTKLDWIGVPGWLLGVALAICASVAVDRQWFTDLPWAWWVLGCLGGLAWLTGGVWMVGVRLLAVPRVLRLQAERAAGYTTAKYAPNFMVRPPEVDYVDGETGHVVKLSGEPWLTVPEYEDRLGRIRSVSSGGQSLP
jgi:hypothetical protein